MILNPTHINFNKRCMNESPKQHNKYGSPNAHVKLYTLIIENTPASQKHMKHL